MLTRAPIFVVGMNGSGTTMLLDHLDSHPQLFGFPLETKILPHYLTGLPRYADLSDDHQFLALFREIAKAFPFLAVNGGLPVPIPETWQFLPRTPAAIFDYMMAYFAAREAKTRWCEKSPMHVQYISIISTAFPDAQFIHVIRDGRDCAASFHRRWGYTPQSTIYRWKRSVREGRSQGTVLGSDRYLEVFYEHLTADPSSQLNDVCNFLGIDFVKATLLARRDGSRVRGLSEIEMVENSGKYKVYFTGRQLRVLERIAGATLASLGYPTDFPAADHDPPVAQRKLWRVTDRLRFAMRLVIGKIQSPDRFPWRLMGARFQRAFRQFFSERF